MMIAVILSLGLAIQPAILQGFFNLFGTVRDEDGRVVTSVRVSLVDENYQPKGTVITDLAGHYKFKNLRAGTYYLRVEPSGLPYEEYSKQIDLYSMTPRASTLEEPTLEDIVLKRKKPFSNSSVGPPGVVFFQDVPLKAKEEFEHALKSINDKHFELGIAQLRRAIEMFPEYFDALEVLGTQYVKREEFDTAIPFLMRAIGVNNKSASARYALGVAHLKMDHPDEAIESLSSAIALDPINPNAYLMLGIAYGNAGLLDRSEAALKKSYEQGGAEAADSHLYLASIYDKREKFADAGRELELYLKEARGLKDKTQIREMIAKLKAKERSKP